MRFGEGGVGKGNRPSGCVTGGIGKKVGVQVGHMINKETQGNIMHNFFRIRARVSLGPFFNFVSNF